MFKLSGKILKDSTFLVISDFISKALFFLFAVLAARILVKEDYGNFAFIFAANKIIFSLFDFGMHHFATREISRSEKNTNKLIGAITFAKILLVFIILGLTSVYSYWLLDSKIEPLVFLLCTLGIIGDSFGDYYENICIALRGVRSAVISKFIYAGLLLVCCCLLWNFSSSYSSLMYIIGLYVVVGVIHPIYALIASLKIAGLPKISYDKEKWLWIWREASFIGIVLLFIALYTRIDQLMLKYINGESAVANYDIAFKFKDGFTLILAGIMRVIFPEMSRLFFTNKDKLKNFTLSIMGFLFVCFIPVLIFIFIYGDSFIVLIFKLRYIESFKALKILTVASLFIYLSNPLYFLIIAANRQKMNTYFMGIALMIKFVLNCLILGKYGYNGAAFATLITEAFIFVVLFYYCFSILFKNKICENTGQ